MTPRFTIIQGGLAETAPRAAGSAVLSLVTDAFPASGVVPAGWRVVLRRPHELLEAETEEWRALAARTTNLDPFSDPDFLATAVLHEPRGQAGGVAFALAYASGEGGIERLRGVLPLVLPNPVWGGSAVSLWQAALAPRPVEPVFDDGAGPDAIAAVLDHLARTNPRVVLRLSGIGASGDLLAALRADRRLSVAQNETPASIPQAQFVSVGARETVTRTERVTSPDAIRDAVERFLLVDARRSRRPLLPDPAAASTIRVVSRLFARRGLIEVELNSAFGEDVSAAIRLGRAGERVLWRAADLDEAAPPRPRTADLAIARAGACERDGETRMVVS